MPGQIPSKRRETMFGVAVLVAGFAIANLCLMPLVLVDSLSDSLFRTSLEEKFFFDTFGLISACWLLSWVSAVNNWKQMAKIGQWLGIVVLCADQAIMIEVWKQGSQYNNLAHFVPGLLIAPTLVQGYLLGCFLGLFTMPALTAGGNKTLTGLGTLLLLLPWLIGRDQVVLGSQYLNGLFL